MIQFLAKYIPGWKMVYTRSGNGWAQDRYDEVLDENIILNEMLYEITIKHKLNLTTTHQNGSMQILHAEIW